MLRWRDGILLMASLVVVTLVLGQMRALPDLILAANVEDGDTAIRLDGEEIEVFTYRPTGCSTPSIMIVFHGDGRTAKSYRDAARELADRECLVVYAPLFDEDRFPVWRYHRGGLLHDGVLQPEADWTVGMVDDLVDWARRRENRPDMTCYLFGHSAGGQFLSRFAAYESSRGIARVIIANPSSYVVPNLKEDAPYGFGGVWDGSDAQRRLQAYLAAPVTIFLGEADTGDNELLKNEPAMRQGPNRLLRGENVFRQGQRIAEMNGWPFNWRLVEAPGVGHSVRDMMDAPEAEQAMGRTQ